jgi:hypothetical protein
MQHYAPVGIHSYTLTRNTPDVVLLMFSQWAPTNRPEEIPGLVQKLADQYLAESKQRSDFKLASREYRVEQFTGSECQVNYAMFQTTSGGANAVETMFVMTVDGAVWIGEFTGPTNAWIQAIEILKSVRKNG